MEKTTVVRRVVWNGMKLMTAVIRQVKIFVLDSLNCVLVMNFSGLISDKISW